MSRKGFLIRSDDEATSSEELGNVVAESVESSGCVQLKLEDFSLAMGQPCRYVAIEGSEEAIDLLKESWRQRGLTVDDADQPVFELTDESDSNESTAEDRK